VLFSIFFSFAHDTVQTVGQVLFLITSVCQLPSLQENSYVYHC